MSDVVSAVTDDDFRARNADINTIGQGVLWALLALLPPVFFYYFARRVFPSLNPWLAAIGGTILVLIPLVNGVVGILLLVYAFKRIGGKFIAGQFLLYFLLVAVALAAVFMLPMFLVSAPAGGAVPVPAAAGAAVMVPPADAPAAAPVPAEE